MKTTNNGKTYGVLALLLAGLASIPAASADPCSMQTNVVDDVQHCADTVFAAVAQKKSDADWAYNQTRDGLNSLIDSTRDNVEGRLNDASAEAFAYYNEQVKPTVDGAQATVNDDAAAAVSAAQDARDQGLQAMQDAITLLFQVPGIAQQAVQDAETLALQTVQYAEALAAQTVQDAQTLATQTVQDSSDFATALSNFALCRVVGPSPCAFPSAPPLPSPAHDAQSTADLAWAIVKYEACTVGGPNPGPCVSPI
ncbi:MAG: hypothetical protein QOI63_120 [Thermoplasmata archaeon]|nr:hypothetical protein [Thermoplasmata archaeon]